MSGGRRRAGASTAFGCFLITLVGPVPSLNATFGLFLGPVSRETHVSRAAVSAMLLAMALSGAVCLPAAGRLADRFGARRVVLCGALVLPMLVAALSRLGDPLLQGPLRFLLFAGLGAASAACGAPLLARSLSGWFEQRRGVVLGLVAGGGNGLGCVLMPALATLLIERAGWRNAYLGVAALMAVLGVSAVLLLLRDPPQPAGADREAGGMSRAEAARTPAFWLILLVLALGAGSLTAIFTHAAPMLLDHGVRPWLATAVMSAIALSGSVWQPVMGAILDRSGDPRWLAPPFALAALSLWLLVQGTGSTTLLAGAIGVGLAIGTDYAAVPLLVSRYFGLRAFAEIAATLFGINAVVLGLAPLLADMDFDRSGSYAVTGWVAAALLLFCSACCLLLPRFKDCRTDGCRTAR